MSSTSALPTTPPAPLPPRSSLLSLSSSPRTTAPSLCTTLPMRPSSARPMCRSPSTRWRVLARWPSRSILSPSTRASLACASGGPLSLTSSFGPTARPCATTSTVSCAPSSTARPTLFRRAASRASTTRALRRSRLSSSTTSVTRVCSARPWRISASRCTAERTRPTSSLTLRARAHGTPFPTLWSRRRSSPSPVLASDPAARGSCASPRLPHARLARRLATA
mmetsp:Transcript_8633/g.23699  ORF Transcript_8633/g.23699 Transcript_8633/m.23699 type:complete len:223 (+) Transcript_8633:742-1410(+)